MIKTTPFLTRFLATAILLTSCGCGHSNPEDRRDADKKPAVDERVRQQAFAALANSKSTEVIFNAVDLFINTRDEEGIDKIIFYLGKEEFRHRVNNLKDPKKEWYVPHKWPKILTKLSEMPPEEEQRSFMKVTENKEFMADPNNVSYFLRNCYGIPYPGTKLLEFLQKRAQPDVYDNFSVVMILISMESPKAWKVVEDWFFASKDNTDKSRYFFLSREFLPNRDKPNNLRFMETLFAREKEMADVRDDVIIYFFDYQRKWFNDQPAEGWPKPPSRREATEETLTKVLALADLALKMDLNENARATVKREKADIEKTLEFRRDGHPARIEKLISDLASEQFKARDQATHELEKYGERVIPFLHRALEKEGRLEPRQRIERILENLDPRYIRGGKAGSVP